MNNRFSTWAKQRGTMKLSRELGVHYTTICKWVAQNNQPRTQFAAAIIALSIQHPHADGKGPLTYDDIYSGQPLTPVLAVTVPCEARA